MRCAGTLAPTYVLARYVSRCAGQVGGQLGKWARLGRYRSGLPHAQPALVFIDHLHPGDEGTSVCPTVCLPICQVCLSACLPVCLSVSSRIVSPPTASPRITPTDKVLEYVAQCAYRAAGLCSGARGTGTKQERRLDPDFYYSLVSSCIHSRSSSIESIHQAAFRKSLARHVSCLDKPRSNQPQSPPSSPEPPLLLVAHLGPSHSFAVSLKVPQSYGLTVTVPRLYSHSPTALSLTVSRPHGSTTYLQVTPRRLTSTPGRPPDVTWPLLSGATRHHVDSHSLGRSTRVLHQP